MYRHYFRVLNDDVLNRYIPQIILVHTFVFNGGEKISILGVSRYKEENVWSRVEDTEINER